MKKLLFILIILSSCRATKIRNIHTPTKREINKAMKYSSWEYDNHQKSTYHNSVYNYQK